MALSAAILALLGCGTEPFDPPALAFPHLGLSPQEVHSAALGRYEPVARHHPSLKDRPSQVRSRCRARPPGMHS